MDIEMPKSKVYALLDSDNRVLRIDGGYTIDNVGDDWTYIDEGYGDKYNLCQSHYLDSPLYDDDGNPRWKYEDGECKLIEVIDNE